MQQKTEQRDTTEEKDLEFYLTMNKTKAALAEREQFSLWKRYFCYVEDYPEKFYSKFAKKFFLIELSRKSVDWKICERCEKEWYVTNFVYQINLEKHLTKNSKMGTE